MTKLVILSSAERRRFDSPPNFTGDERSIYFSLPPDAVLSQKFPRMLIIVCQTSEF